ncbi:MAG: AbrB/MazE/SpoVT family DNA-binding domain-containing protein [Acidimicrobiia bacterium]|nr:AbrB/MazE/SpoVT family DNA-binding domain-containing protein [Acidimicrobiia bacterium]
MKVTIDSAGRLVIPKPIRDSAGLESGVELEIEYRDGIVQIEPAAAPLKWAKRGSFKVAVAP